MKGKNIIIVSVIMIIIILVILIYKPVGLFIIEDTEKVFEFDGYRGVGITQHGYEGGNNPASGSSSIKIEQNKIVSMSSTSGGNLDSKFIIAQYSLEVGTLHDFCISYNWRIGTRDDKASSNVFMCSNRCISILSVAGSQDFLSSNKNTCFDLKYKEIGDILHLVVDDGSDAEWIELVDWDKDNINITVNVCSKADIWGSSRIITTLYNLVPDYEPQCNFHSDCDDNNLCTTNNCENHICVYNIIECENGGICNLNTGECEKSNLLLIILGALGAIGLGIVGYLKFLR